MAFTLSTIAAKDSAGTAIGGGLLAADKAGGGVGPFIMGHLLVDGVAGTNLAKVDASNRVSMSIDNIAAALTLATITTVGAVTSITNALPAGTNNIGDVDVLTVPADPFGANADAASATGSISAKLRFIAATGIPITGTVTVGSHAVTNAGTFAVQSASTLAAETTKVIGTINIAAAQTLATVTTLTTLTGTTSLTPGTAAANLGKAEDAVHASGDVGVMALAVRQDSQVSFAADGDYVPLSVDSGGALRVSGGGGGTQYTEDVAGAADPVGSMLMAVRRDTLSASEVSADGDNIALKATNKGQLHTLASLWDGTNALTLVQNAAGTNDWAVPVMIHPDSTGVVSTVAHDAVDSGDPLKIGGYAKAAAPTDVSADGDRVNAWYLRNGAQSVTVTAAGALIGGDAANGLDVDVTRMPTDPFGANADAASATGSISAKLRFIAATGIPITGTVTVGAHAVTNAGTFAVQSTAAGDVAAGAADSGNPIKVGLKATTSLSGLTLVSDANRTNAFAGIDGVQITRPHCNLEDIVDGTASNTDGTITTVVAAAGAGIKQYITRVSLSNTHATQSTMVALKSGTTSRWRVNVPPGGREFAFDPPLKPNAANEVWAFDPDTATTTIECSMVGFKSKV